jgi:threonine dehydratase
MTKQEAVKELAKIVADARKQLDDAKKAAIKLADEFGLTFVWDKTYGNQEQEYLGKGTLQHEYNYQTKKYEEVLLDKGKWTSSSEGC